MRACTVILSITLTMTIAGCKKAPVPPPSSAPSPASTTESASSAGIELKIAQWGFLTKYKTQIEQYVKSKGIDLTITYPTPYLSEHKDIFDYIRSEQADIVVTPQDVIKSSQAKLINIIAPIDINQISNYSKIDSELRTNAAYRSMVEDEEKIYAIPYRADIITLLYDSSRVATPKSYDVLFDPVAKGKYCLQKYQREFNVRVVLLALGYKDSTFNDIDSEIVDWDKVISSSEQLAANAYGAFDITSAPIVELVDMPDDAVKKCVYFPGIGDMLPALNKNGGKWNVALLDPGTQLWVDVFCIAKHLQNQSDKLHAAHLVIDYMLSDEMQLCTLTDQAYTPVTANVRAKLVDQKNDDPRLNPHFYKDYAQSQSLPQTTRSVNFIQKIWDDAARKIGRAKEFLPRSEDIRNLEK